MNYKVEVKDLKKCKMQLDFEVPASEVTTETEKMYNEVQQRAKIAGFRPGKAPMEMVKQYYTSTVKEHVIENLIRESMSAVFKEKNIHPIDSPVIEKIDFDFNKPFVFSAVLENFPETTLKNYKHLKVKKEIKKVSDDDINKNLTSLQKYHARLGEPKTDSVTKTSCVYVTYKVFDESVPDSSGTDSSGTELKKMNAENQLVDIGEQQLIPGFSDGLIGMKINDEKEIKVKIPENFFYKEIAGKNVVFKTKIISIKDKIFPNIDNEFAKDMGCKDLPELKQKVREQLEHEAEHHAEELLRAKIGDKLVEMHSMEVPQSLVDKQYEYLLHSFEWRLKRQGIPQELINNQKVSSTEKFKQEADKQVKLIFILNSIAKQEKIEVNEEDVQHERQHLLQSQPGKEKDVDNYINGNKEHIQNEIRIEKVYKLLMNNL